MRTKHIVPADSFVCPNCESDLLGPDALQTKITFTHRARVTNVTIRGKRALSIELGGAQTSDVSDDVCCSLCGNVLDFRHYGGVKRIEMARLT